MGRDRTRVLLCAAVSLALIFAAALMMDWYRLAFEFGTEEISRVAIAIDLRSVHTCTAIHVCTTAQLGPPGMFSTLATVTLWSSMAFAALVGAQAGARVLTGNASETIAKLGYMFALTTLSITIATAYMFGAETDGPGIQIAAHMGHELERTWAPLTLIVGLIAGFATLYMSVAPDSSDLGDSYKPITLTNLRAPGEPPAAPVQVPAVARAATRPLRPSGRPATMRPSNEPAPPPPSDPLIAQFAAIASRSNEQTHPVVVDAAVRKLEAYPAARASSPVRPRRPSSNGIAANSAGASPIGSGPLPRLSGAAAEGTVIKPSTDARASIAPGVPRPAVGPQVNARSGSVPARRTVTGPYPLTRRPPTDPPGASRRAATERAATEHPSPATTGRVPLIGPATTTSQVPMVEPTASAQPVTSHLKSGLIPVPEHLRNQLSYVALTAELTGGGIDARREDGTSRLVLWRDVVGVVVRRMPPLFDDALFVDIVSTARSTLRILPWTRLTGDPVGGDGDARVAQIVAYVLARCPAAKLDPATRQFLDTGEPAQIPDLETLRAHDARLA